MYGNLEVVRLSYSPYRSQHYYTVLFFTFLWTNSIAFIVSHTLLFLYYQVKSMWFSRCKLTVSVSCS